MSNRPFQEPYSVGRCAHCAPVRNFHAMASITCVKNVGTLLWGARTLSDSDDWRTWEQVREAAGH